MRRKAGALIPLEISILERALAHKVGGDAEIHGFQIASELGGGARTLLSHGGLYKALSRLEQAGMLERRWEDPMVAAAEGRPRRKYYRLTADGQRALYAAQQSFPSVLGQPAFGDAAV